jgi:hypothetical protein
MEFFADDDVIHSVEHLGKEELPVYNFRPVNRNFSVVLPQIYKNIFTEQVILGQKKELLFLKIIFVASVLFIGVIVF